MPVHDAPRPMDDLDADQLALHALEGGFAHQCSGVNDRRGSDVGFVCVALLAAQGLRCVEGIAADVDPAGKGASSTSVFASMCPARNSAVCELGNHENCRRE